MLPGMEQLGVRWQPDGDVVYREELGGLVAVLPRYCRRWEHDLAGQYRARINRDDIVHISCQACSAAPHPDHAWALRTGGRTPDRAELNDAPYYPLRRTLKGTNGAAAPPHSRPW